MCPTRTAVFTDGGLHRRWSSQTGPTSRWIGRFSFGSPRKRVRGVIGYGRRTERKSSQGGRVLRVPLSASGERPKGFPWPHPGPPAAWLYFLPFRATHPVPRRRNPLAERKKI